MYFYYDKNEKEIKISLYRNGENIKIFNLDLMSIEECDKCSFKLTINNAYYFVFYNGKINIIVQTVLN